MSLFSFGRKQRQDVDVVTKPTAGTGEVWVTTPDHDNSHVWLQTDHWTNNRTTAANPLTPDEAEGIAANLIAAARAVRENQS